MRLISLRFALFLVLATWIGTSDGAGDFKLLVLPLNPGQKCPNNVEQVVNSCAKCSCYFDLVFCKTSCDLVSLSSRAGFGGPTGTGNGLRV